MNKKKILTIILLLFVAASVGAGGFYYYQSNIKPDTGVSDAGTVRSDGKCRIGLYAAHDAVASNLNNSRSALPLSTLQSAFNVATSNITAANKELRTITSADGFNKFDNLDFIFITDANLGEQTETPTKNSSAHQSIQSYIQQKWYDGTNLIIMGDSSRHTDGSTNASGQTVYVGDHAAGTAGPYATNISNNTIRYLYDQQLGGGQYFQEKENWGHFRNNSGEYFLGFTPRQSATLSDTDAPPFLSGATLNFLANTTPGMLIVDNNYAKCIFEAPLKGGDPSTGNQFPTVPSYPSSGSCIAAYIPKDRFASTGYPNNGFMIVDGNYGAITQSRLVQILNSSPDCANITTTPTPDPDPEPTPDPTPPPVNGPGGVVLQPVCVNGKPQINVTWNIVPSTEGYFVDVDLNDSNVWSLSSGNLFWNRKISGDTASSGTRTATIPTNFKAYYGGDPNVSPNNRDAMPDLQTNTSYRVRVLSIQPSGGGNPIGDANGLAVTTASCTRTCYQCNTTTFACTSATVNSEVRCNGSDGYYTTQSGCQVGCAEPTKTCYRCNTTSYTCEFETVSQSTSCDGANGLYSDISQCTNGCNEPTKSCYTCDSATSTCSVEQVSQSTVCDGTGLYFNDESTCLGNCITPTIPDPTIEKTGTAGETGPEQTEVSYSVVVNNNHTEERIFDVKDTLPTGVNNPTNISNNGSYDSGSNSITWDNITISGSGSVTLTYTLTVPRASYGNLLNTAQVLESDSSSVLDQTTETVTITFTELEITKDGLLTNVDSSQSTLDYTLHVSNPNEYVVDNVSVKDTIPVGTTQINSVNPSPTTQNLGSRTIEWTGLTFASLETKTFTYTLTLGPSGYSPSGPDSVDNTAQVSVDNVVQDTDDESIPVDATTEATISKASNITYTPSTVVVNYTITARNTGNTDILNYSVIDDLDSNVNDSMVSNISNSGTLNNGTIRWNDVDISVDQSRTFTYTVTISRSNPGDYDNTVVLYDESSNEVAQDDQSVNVPAVVVVQDNPVPTPEPTPSPTPPSPQPVPAQIPETAIFGNSGTYIIFGAMLMISGLIVYKLNLGRTILSKLGIEEYSYAELEMTERNKVELRKKK